MKSGRRRRCGFPGAPWSPGPLFRAFTPLASALPFNWRVVKAKSAASGAPRRWMGALSTRREANYAERTQARERGDSATTACRFDQPDWKLFIGRAWPRLKPSARCWWWHTELPLAAVTLRPVGRSARSGRGCPSAGWSCGSCAASAGTVSPVSATPLACPRARLLASFSALNLRIGPHHPGDSNRSQFLRARIMSASRFWLRTLVSAWRGPDFHLNGREVVTIDVTASFVRFPGPSGSPGPKKHFGSDTFF